jgi:hypothetical protein
MLFQKLPGELRNEIIRLAVVEVSEIKPTVSRSLDALTDKFMAKLEIEHPLLRTCKQLRQESGEIYFLENTFHLANGDFFTLSSCKQGKANERAMQALVNAFGPFASKVRRLNVSHATSYDTAEVHVSICRAASGVYLEKACAHDADTHPLCCCSIIRYGIVNSAAETIFEFAQGLVAMMDQVTGKNPQPHCWNCGLEPMM